MLINYIDVWAFESFSTYSVNFLDILGVMLTQEPWNQLEQMSQPT